ncbi:MAG TPA: hypothetical protein VMN58_10910 [Acidimicrobiales bacterium]|nr:hypothetical protein [Acidimicrobiales bacterium]
MYAIVGVSKLGPEAKPEMAQGILANLRSAPGFVSGTFTRSPDGKNGRSMVLFETEEAAETAAANARASIPDDAPVEITSIEVYEVVAHA